MAMKWWKTGLSVLAITAGLLICAMPATGGEVARWAVYDGAVRPPSPGEPNALSALDGSFLTLTNGQSVVVKFASALGVSPASLRIHMDATSAGAADTLIWLSPADPTYGTPTGFIGFLGDSGGSSIGQYTLTGYPGGPTKDWFEFTYDGTYVFTFSAFQYVQITAPANVSISIDAVEALPFTTLALPPAVDMLYTLAMNVAVINNQQGIPNVITNSLEAKLATAFDALNDVHGNNYASAVNKLQAFINEVNAQRGNKITDEQATDLIDGVHDALDPSDNFYGAQEIINRLTGAQ